MVKASAVDRDQRRSGRAGSGGVTGGLNGGVTRVLLGRLLRAVRGVLGEQLVGDCRDRRPVRGSGKPGRDGYLDRAVDRDGIPVQDCQHQGFGVDRRKSQLLARRYHECPHRSTEPGVFQPRCQVHQDGHDRARDPANQLFHLTVKKDLDEPGNREPVCRSGAQAADKCG